MKYAIDIPRHQQFYIRYQGLKDVKLLKEILEPKGFHFEDYIGTCDYSFPILVVNYLDKDVFGSNVTNMACAAQCGATILSVDRFLKEIVEEN
ncbi:MAG: hypothetical protein K9L02_04730 [Acholeplasmataceae bacterium]|nr:hypothetical protein [Acholeplasmataceae bacterium]